MPPSATREPSRSSLPTISTKSSSTRSPTWVPSPIRPTRSTHRSPCSTRVEAKGLEFDQVIVVEPARLVTHDSRGLRLLYVVLTRATRRLVVVHAEPLPEALSAVTTPTGAPVAAS